MTTCAYAYIEDEARSAACAGGEHTGDSKRGCVGRGCPFLILSGMNVTCGRTLGRLGRAEATAIQGRKRTERTPFEWDERHELKSFHFSERFGFQGKRRSPLFFSSTA
eukprot:6196180-Pleurochrysis_carterae.AAC.2